MGHSGLHLPHIFLKSPAEQSPLERALAQSMLKPYSSDVAPSVLSWWEAGRQGDVVLAMNQLLPAMVDANANNIADGYDTGATTSLAFTNGEQSFTPTAQYGNFRKASVNLLYNAQNRIIAYADVLATDATVNLAFQDLGGGTGISIVPQSHSGSGLWETLKTTFYCTTLPTDCNLRLRTDAVSGWTVVKTKNWRTHNLTTIFGAGNEPTALEMDAILAADYAATGISYWEGSRNVVVNHAHNAVLNQRLTNGNFANGTTGWTENLNSSVVTTSGNVATLTGNNSNNTVQISNETSTPISVGKVIKVNAYARVRDAGITYLALKLRGSTSGTTGSIDVTQTNPVTDQWYLLTENGTLGATLSGFIRVSLSAVSGGNITQRIEFKIVEMFNLSTDIGAGIEPTAAQMDIALAGKAYWEGASAPITVFPAGRFYASSYGSLPVVAKTKTLTNLLPALADANANNIADGWQCNGSTPASCTAGVQKFTADAQWGRFGRTFPGLSVAGNVIYARVSVNVSSSGVRLQLYPGTGGTYSLKTHSATSGAEFLSATAIVVTASDSSIEVADARLSGWTEIQVEKPMLLNLTTIFGAGNEPTAAQMDAIIAYTGQTYWEGARADVLVNPWDVNQFGLPRFSKLYNMNYTTSSGRQVGPPAYWKGDAIDDWMGRAEAGFIAQDADFSYMCVFSPSADNVRTELGYGLLTDFVTASVVEYYWLTNSLTAVIKDRVSGTGTASKAIAILASSYYIVTCTYSSADKKIRIYIQGSLSETSAAISNGHNAINFARSFRNTAGSTYTAQRQAIEAWFNKALSAAEVKDLYNRNCTKYGLAKV